MNLTNSNIDLHLSPILNSISTALPLFSRVYGRLKVEAVRGVDAAGKDGKLERTLDRPRKMPLWYDAVKKTHVPVVPDEQAGGLLFVITTGPAKIIEPEPGWALSGGSQHKLYPVALIAWWNGANTQTSPDAIRLGIEKKLGKWYDWRTESVDDQLATRVFAGLDYDFDHHRYLLHPFAGLRIEGELTVKESTC